MSSQPAYIPLFGNDYLGDTMHLTTEEHGAYFLLMIAAWRQDDCGLPYDDRKLAKIVRLPTRRWDAIKETILEFWTVEEGRIFQPRLRKEWNYARQKSEANRKSASARWSKQATENIESGSCERTTERNAPQPQPQVEEEPNGSPSQGAGALEGAEAGSDDLFGGEPEKPKAKRKREPKPEEPFVLPDWVPVDEWNAFLGMRDKIKATPTEHALRLLVKKLDELRTSGNDPGEVLEQSTMQNWRGIFEVRKSRNEQRNGYGNSGFGSPAGSRFQPEGSIAEGLRRIELARNHGSSGEAGRWDDCEPEGGYLGSGS